MRNNTRESEFADLFLLTIVHDETLIQFPYGVFSNFYLATYV